MRSIRFTKTRSTRNVLEDHVWFDYILLNSGTIQDLVLRVGTGISILAEFPLHSCLKFQGKRRFLFDPKKSLVVSPGVNRYEIEITGNGSTFDVTLFYA
jgi:hypothetical protein